MFKISFTGQAKKDLKKLKDNEPFAFKKLAQLLLELTEHPMTGTGKPKPLGGDRAGQWSRRITDKHRLVYLIEEEMVNVLLLSSYGHYNDK